MESSNKARAESSKKATPTTTHTKGCYLGTIASQTAAQGTAFLCFRGRQFLQLRVLVSSAAAAALIRIASSCWSRHRRESRALPNTTSRSATRTTSSTTWRSTRGHGQLEGSIQRGSTGRVRWFVLAKKVDVCTATTILPSRPDSNQSSCRSHTELAPSRRGSRRKLERGRGATTSPFRSSLSKNWNRRHWLCIISGPRCWRTASRPQDTLEVLLGALSG